MKRDELVGYLDNLLETARFKDYCPNGLQVEGRSEIGRVVAGVTASQALIDVAIERGADTLLVHHGWFWRGEDGCVTGLRRTRLKSLLAHDIILIGYHLPLDGHQRFGNNAQLAELMGWEVEGRFADQEMGWFGRPGAAVELPDLVESLAGKLGRVPQVIAPASRGRRLCRVAWCSGAAQNLFEPAIALGADVYVSGEISEQTVHLARESGVAYVAAGHHATERGGVMALAAHLRGEFGISCEFVDIDNPV